MSDRSLRRRTLRALLWSGFGEYGASAFRLLSLLALGWLLPPSDFGLLAIGVIFVVFAEAPGELGLPQALVRMRPLDERDRSTAFWSILAANSGLTLVTLGFAHDIAAFLGNPAAAPLLRLLSSVFLANALLVVPRARLLRSLDLRAVSTAQLAGEVVFGITGVAMALLGFGAWSLAGAFTARRWVQSLLIWRSVGWRPSLEFGSARLRRLFGFGAPLLLNGLVERALLNLDAFVVGRWLGTEPLGYYSLASQIARLPVERLFHLVSRVTFPAFSVVQEDLGRLRRALIEGMGHLLTGLVPLVAIVVIGGPWFLDTLYGNKWWPSIEPLRLLGLAGLVSCLRLAEPALVAAGEPAWRLWVSASRLGGFVLIVTVLGLEAGIGAVAASLAAATVISGFVAASMAMVRLEIRPRRVAESLEHPFPAALAAALLLGCLLVTDRPWAVMAVAVAVTTIYGFGVLPFYVGKIRAWRRS
ncbi:MAG: lipopolysaccharide biosynthesis protein [Thermoanaerobaculia bacterium]